MVFNQLAATKLKNKNNRMKKEMNDLVYKDHKLFFKRERKLDSRMTRIQIQTRTTKSNSMIDSKKRLNINAVFDRLGKSKISTPVVSSN